MYLSYDWGWNSLVFFSGDEVQVVLDSTPFYAESGGQLGDRGTLTTLQSSQRNGVEPLLLNVSDVQKAAGGNLYVHTAKVDSGTLRVGEQVNSRQNIGNWKHNLYRPCNFVKGIFEGTWLPLFKFFQCNYAFYRQIQVIILHIDTEQILRANQVIANQKCEKIWAQVVKWPMTLIMPKKSTLASVILMPRPYISFFLLWYNLPRKWSFVNSK